ncbi:MAG: tyrosine-protein kinase Etk/Wzc [Ulvibacter sp.]|jgi:tyrosine-protein kinase Etk/Wzc
MKKEINAITVRPADLFKRLLKNWFWFVLLAGAGYWAADFYLKFQTESFKIEASLKIKEEEENLGRKTIVQDMGFNENINLEDEIFTLKASPLMNRVVNNLRLDITYFHVGQFKETELYNERPVEALVFGDKEMAEGEVLEIAPVNSTEFLLITGELEGDTIIEKYGEVFNLGGTDSLERVDFIINFEKSFEGSLKIYFLDPLGVAEYYSNKLAIVPVGRTKILNFSLIESVPEKGIDVINKLIEYYGASIVEENNEAARKSLSFIDERLAFITEELYRAERNVEAYRMRIQAPLGIGAIAGQYSGEIEEARLKITQLALQEEFLINLTEFLDREDNEYAFLTIPTEAASEIVSSLVSQYNALILTREELLLSADVNNPSVRLMDEQLKSIKSSIRQSISSLLEDNRIRVLEINRELGPAIAGLNAIPEQERELLTMTRIKDSKEGLYMYLLENRERAGLSIASQSVNLKVIDPPINLGLVSPIYNYIYSLGIFLGLIIPLIFILGSELMDNTIHYESDIKEYTETPFLGNIGLATKKNELVVVNGSRSAIAESFHLLRSNLQFMTPNKKNSQVVLFTSNVSGDGKTFISSNLGASLALAGKKTILLSFDLRKPRLSSYLSGAKSEIGVSNFLIDPEMKVANIINRVEGFEHLFFIGSGPIPPNPTDLIYKDRTKTLFNYLRAHFDMILVDTSPVGLVSDALILSKYADASIFIMRYKVTNLQQIGLADDLYHTNKLPNLAIVLNGIKKRRYGYAYSYGSDDGYGYYDNEKPRWKRWFTKKQKAKKLVLKKEPKPQFKSRDKPKAKPKSRRNSISSAKQRRSKGQY